MERKHRFFLEEMIPSSGKEMMTIEYAGISESKEATKDNRHVSERLRHQLKENLTAQIWNNPSTDDCGGLKLTKNFKSIN